MKKILYSPGFGAGWLSWSHTDNAEAEKFMLTYGPLIEAVENCPEGTSMEKHLGLLRQGINDTLRPGSPLADFIAEWKRRFGDEDLPYLGGASDLRVAVVDRPFRITEYDGSEGIEYLNPANYIDPATL